MSTRCLIGKVEKNGKIRAIYCHHDGYLDGVGQTLVDYYNDESTIDELLDLGDLSVLGETPDTIPEYWTSDDTEVQAKMSSGEFCVSYRDRGESNIDAKEYDSERDYYKAANFLWAEYIYLFKNDRWYTFNVISDELTDEDNFELVTVEDAMNGEHM